MTTQTKLAGKELLAKIKELASLSKRETAIECGYSSSKDGKTRVDLTGFYNAALEAKGVTLKAPKENRGREASYEATVHKGGQLLIGSAYTKEMGLKEGDTFTIKLGSKNIQLIKKEPVAA